MLVACLKGCASFKFRINRAKAPQNIQKLEIARDCFVESPNNIIQIDTFIPPPPTPAILQNAISIPYTIAPIYNELD